VVGTGAAFTRSVCSLLIRNALRQSRKWQEQSVENDDDNEASIVAERSRRGCVAISYQPIASRFRSSHRNAARSFANFGIEDHEQPTEKDAAHNAVPVHSSHDGQALAPVMGDEIMS
jgi:hypothetical protein